MEKARLTCLWAILLLVFMPLDRALGCGYNYISSCATQLEIDADGTVIPFYVQNCTYLNNFQNYNFGTLNELSLHKAVEYTWESCTNRVLNAKLYYRIYAVGGSPGAFLALNLSNMVQGGVGDYRNRTFDATPDLDLLAGLTNGTNYNFEVYFFSDVDINNDNVPDANLTRNNGGLNFKATFKKAGNPGGSGLTVSFLSKTNVSCSGGSDGKLTASATGGAPPYTYVWSNNLLGATIQNLPAGTYTVTVTAPGGLSGSATATIVQPPALNPSVTATDETSANANNGTATATASGGTSPYSFLWSTGAASPAIANLDAGTYSVTVSDAKACSSVRTVTVLTAGSVPSGYCAAASNFPWNDWIGQVSLGTLNNTSDKATYSNFTNLSAPNLTAGDAYAMTLKTGNGWFPYQTFWRAWIDFDRDGIFENAEQVFDQQSNPPASGLSQLSVTQTVNIPATATEGITRMRVAMKRSASPLACESFQFGEIEDYHVTIVAPAGTCQQTATVTNIACNNNGTNANPDDDRYNFTLTVTGTGVGSTWSANINGSATSGTYGTAKNLGPYNISAGQLSFTIQDGTTATCHKNVFVTPPPPCSNAAPCTLNAAVSNLQCDNNGTTNTGADDKYSFALTVSGSGLGAAGWTANVGGSPQTGSYGTAKNLGPYLISGGVLSFTIQDAQNAACTYPVTVAPPAPCSVSGGPTNYCQSKSDFPWHEWISKVTFAGLNNPTGKWYYTDYTSLNAAVVRGQSYPISLYASFSWDANPQYYRVWIDYNRDGVFQEPAEMAYQGILSGAPSGSQDAQLSGNISIPATASPGATRMRISMKRGGYPTPCEALIPFGEVEDYTVDIAASLAPGGVASRDNVLRIGALARGEQNIVETALNTLAAVQHMRLERAGADFEWHTLQEWSDLWLPETENVRFETADEHPLDGENHYRLALGLADGNIVFSNVETVRRAQVGNFALFPNPATPGREVFLNLENWPGEALDIAVYHATGKLIFTKKIAAPAENIVPLPLDNLANGEYLVFVQSASMRPVGKRLVILQEF